MKPSDLIEFMRIAEQLKCNTRHSWTSTNRHESVAEHSWRLSLLAFMVQDEFPTLNIQRVIEMAIIHDLGEAIIGDIPAFDKKESDEILEDEALSQLFKTLPQFYYDRMTSLWDEMKALETPESKLFLALDKMEAVIQHNEASLDTWTPLEHTYNIEYGEAQVKDIPYMKALKKLLNDNSREKIAEAQ